MHYLRFLKVPTTSIPEPPKNFTPQSTTVTVTTLITISTDLGEFYLNKDAIIRASLRRSDNPDRTVLSTAAVYWKPGMRNAEIKLIHRVGRYAKDIPREGIVCVTVQDLAADDMRNLSIGGAYHKILSAWSPSFSIWSITKAEALVERKLQLSPTNMISIWEETREDIARHIWPGGLAVTSWLANQSPRCAAGSLPIFQKFLQDSDHLEVLELGAGCGLAGIALHTQIPEVSGVTSSKITLTDLPITSEITQRNLSELKVNKDSKHQIRYCMLDWEAPLPEPCKQITFNLILVADCTYNTDSIPALVNVLAQLCKISPDVKILLAHKVRHEDESIFFELAKKEGIREIESMVFEMAGDVVDLYLLGKG